MLIRRSSHYIMLATLVLGLACTTVSICESVYYRDVEVYKPPPMLVDTHKITILALSKQTTAECNVVKSTRWGSFSDMEINIANTNPATILSKWFWVT